MGNGIDGPRDRQEAVCIAPGNLMLGHLAPVLYDCGYLLTLGARMQGSDRSALYQRIDSEPRHIRRLAGGMLGFTPIHAIEDLTSPDGVRRIEQAIARAATRLVVISVRAGLPDVLPMLCRAIDERVRTHDAPLLVVLAENVFDPLFVEVGRTYESTNCRFVRSVADRICRAPARTEPDVDVVTEASGTWLVEDDRSGLGREIFRASNVVRFVPDAAPHLKAKLMVVNGVEFAAALCAWHAEELMVSHFLRNPVEHEFIQRVALELADSAALDPVIGRRAAREEALRSVDRWALHGGLVVNAFGGETFLTSGRPGFEVKLRQRLVDPLFALICEGRPNGALSYVFNVARETIDRHA